MKLQHTDEREEVAENRAQSNRWAPERQPGLLSYGNTTSDKTDKTVHPQSQTRILFCFRSSSSASRAVVRHRAGGVRAARLSCLRGHESASTEVPLAHSMGALKKPSCVPLLSWGLNRFKKITQKSVTAHISNIEE